MRSVVILQLGLGLILSACGSETTNDPRLLPSGNNRNSTSLAIYRTEPVIQAFERSDENPNLIVPILRVLHLLGYDQIIQESLTQDQKYSNYLVTGIGLEAGIQVLQNGELQTRQMPIRMALRAREWDSKNNTFKSGTQIFGVQGVNLENTQEFSIVDPSTPNFVMTGLGLKLREGKFTKLELKRSSLANLNESSFEHLSAANRIELPAGWAAVGLIIGVDRVSATVPVREPFVEDVRIYTGWVGAMPN